MNVCGSFYRYRKAIILTALVLFFSFSAIAQSFTVTAPGSHNGPAQVRGTALFPSIYYTDAIISMKKAEAFRPYWVQAGTEVDGGGQLPSGSLLLDNDILAFYGHPNSKNMGILGRYSIEELDVKLTDLAREYEAESGGRKVLKAFYIIFGTVWPEGEIGIIGEETLKRYVDYALEHNMLVFIDHQIGKYDPVNSLKRMLPWLKYPNVHLALDPEWRTTKPMKEIGRVTADELNRAQRAMEDYLIENDLPGERLFVVHQFKPWMIENRNSVKTDFSRVRLVHCADGFGNPNQKRGAYASNAEALNIPIKAFKLFYNFNIPGAGFDSPLLSPKDVYALNPRPYVIMYQ